MPLSTTRSRRGRASRPLVRPPPPGPNVPLRLIAAHGGLGIELYEPLSLGVVQLREMVWTFPGLSFPVDLSGGVRSFRNRRGQLQRLRLQLDLEALRRWLSNALRGALGGLVEPVGLWCVEGGIGVGLTGQQGALAFEMLWVPQGGGARWVLNWPRSAGALQGPAVGHALLLLEQALPQRLARSGRVIELGDMATAVMRAVLPDLGIRLPASHGLWVGHVELREESLSVTLDATLGPSPLNDVAVRALEFARVVQRADDLLISGRSEEARAEYVQALEQLPKHPELCLAVAAVDRHFHERAEAALGLLVESLPATEFGWVGAELLAEVGDREGAILALTKAAQREPYAPLAAMQWVQVSKWADGGSRRLQALDRAVAVSPRLSAARWERLRARVEYSDLVGALADAEHLEAAARGAQQRHQVLVAAGEALLQAGHCKPAGKLFERALRYAPSDARSAVGLARALLESGKADRAFALLERATELAPPDSQWFAQSQLFLAELLAERYHDLPQAIARARQVHGSGVLVLKARALEGRYRCELGDIAGASVAYARMNEGLEWCAVEDRRHALPWLLEAAQFAERVLLEDASAERYLGSALRVYPQHAQALREYRRVAKKLVARQLAAAELGGPGSSGGTEPENESVTGGSVDAMRGEETRARSPSAAPPEEETAELPANAAEPVGALDAAHPAVVRSPLSESDLDPDDAERLVEETKAQLMASGALAPGVVEQLAQALQVLGRDEELFALLQARYEDAESAERTRLAPLLQATLRRLHARAREQGDAAEADMYQSLLEGFDA